ncbi:FecR family protein [Acinetobacter rathckeae]|uniref:FecR family protein n=1 Tax=Acinetobacter rathckeae TaxID=2605272 RepID=UPI0018A2CB6E|nr:FecR domain-containing protein [Acinetobacter rathckeae]MBF7688549.1 FecR domain-containing protein [Acinetobacter rathckeae]MBF7695796.1 FecR domain-containing protein [Acinetobacter rathckeae]
MIDPNLQSIQKEISLWIIRLNHEDPIERKQAKVEFETWLLQHPEYYEQLEKVGDFSNELRQLRKTHQMNSQVIQMSFESRQKKHQQFQKMLRRSLLGIGCLCIVSGLLYGYLPYNYYSADYKTTTGEVKNITLSDGSKVILAAKSAIKLNYTATIRQIELIQGDIYVDVARDKNRPLVIATKQAQYTALGTRFIVDQYQKTSQISMLHSSVHVCSLHTAQSQTVQAGQKMIVSDTGLTNIQDIPVQMTDFAWQHQQILADNLALPDLLTRLNYQFGTHFIYQTSSLEPIKVNGIINIQQDVSQILALIHVKNPQLQIHQISPNLFILRLNK